MAAGPEAWNTSELLAACCGAAVQVWAPLSADPRRDVAIDEAAGVSALDWSGNNKVLAVAGDKAQITMVGGGKVIGYVPEVPEASLSGVTAMRFSADSKRLAIGCTNRALHIRDLRSQGAGNKCIIDHKAPVAALAISPDDSLLVSSSAGGQVMLHDFKTGAKLASLAHDGAARSAALQFCASDADRLATASDDGGVAVWSVAARAARHELRRLHRGGATGVRFAPDSPHVLYSCGKDGRLLVLDTRQPTQQQQETLAAQASQPLTCLDARFDARSLAVGTSGGAVLVFDLRRPGQEVGSRSFGDAAGPVACVRWQHAPHAGSKHKAAAAASAGGAAISGAPGRLTAAAAPAAAAAALSAQGGRGDAILAARGAPAAAAGAFGPHAPAAAAAGRSVTPEPARGVSPEPSAVSGFSLDGFTRAVSPVRLSDPDTRTPTGPNTAGAGAAAAATPGDSFASGVGAFMVTPGVGVTRGLAAAQGLAAADGTPISRIAQFAASDPQLPPPRPQQPVLGAAGGSRGERAALDTQNRPAADAAPPPPGGAKAGPPAGAGGARHGGVAAQAAAGVTPRGYAGSRQQAGSGVAARAAAITNAAGGGLGSRAASAASSAAVEAAAVAALEGAAGAASARAAQEAGAAAAAAGPGAGVDGVFAGPGAGMMLREDVFRAYIDQQTAAVRQDVRSLHLEVLQQFHQAQMDLMSVVEGLAQRQEAIVQRLEALGRQVQEAADSRGAGGLQSGGGGVGISMAWL
ncbi:hypothetical protein MNEG_2756 [Monoraphidium neglectum]|uniref:Uncharacterized protein n=1 Tax=Monoraphidium neglectum TaxID=145388 RepID=A0A0D2MXY0_9CHLO|nr:hypothetical protein MNEG_2756 [Monoraphidium neglectum]KIZ05202.1 hypothetical protein MNEG_2756 [Monoraphidium neglectum]|eukprot:XP_013904221.1 hypothetical protein MNEG_2756 [Monoraphidium neglectum]